MYSFVILTRGILVLDGKFDMQVHSFACML
ncbi:hypothetical protein F383_04037 [Gossypium arboreum]|uniref:Uncharacterized protein n=1 Tax=Gossypium arboreum TaxID=29729 RepID=A0A0B0P2R2_GOSAR|nr:hypothetical protein F383_04037 [Gossypium arboreum]